MKDTQLYRDSDLRIVHLSDLHIARDGNEIWGTDTLSHFHQAIDIISSLKDINAIIVTGDLSNDGSSWSYNYIIDCLKQLEIPTFCCPGNHDNLETMQLTCPNLLHISNFSTKINGY